MMAHPGQDLAKLIHRHKETVRQRWAGRLDKRLLQVLDSAGEALRIDWQGVVLEHLQKTLASGMRREEVAGDYLSPLVEFIWREGLGIGDVIAACSLLRLAVWEALAGEGLGLEHHAALISAVERLASAAGREYDRMVERQCRHMQYALGESEEKYRKLVENSLLGIYLIRRGRFLYVNPKLAEIFGYTREEVLELPVLELVAPEDRQLVAENLRRRERGEVEYINYEFRGLKKDGTVFDVEVLGSRVILGGRPAVIGTLMDITQRKLLERARRDYTVGLERKVGDKTRQLAEAQSQLIHSEKLAATGKLAAAIAHEINNPIYGIQGCLEKICEDLPAEHPDKYFVLKALEGSQRIVNLIRKLQDFYQPADDQLRPADINILLEDVLIIQRNYLLINRVTLTKTLQPDLPQLKVSPSQIQQVFLNIISNAVEAMPEGGRLHIATLRCGECVCVEFHDTGCGIPPENMAKIFDPFFTTKKDVVGAGLGLSVSYGIVKKHGGNIFVTSQPGAGTTFRIELPALPREEAQEIIS